MTPRDEATKLAAEVLLPLVGQEVTSAHIRTSTGIHTGTVKSILDRMIQRGEAQHVSHGRYKILAPLGSRKKGVIHCEKCGHVQGR